MNRCRNSHKHRNDPAREQSDNQRIGCGFWKEQGSYDHHHTYHQKTESKSHNPSKELRRTKITDIIWSNPCLDIDIR
ncbi:MAG: hypothetical protein AAB613_01930 [Patescibacteria group bacterium]